MVDSRYDKKRLRVKTAAKPFADKVRILEKLRERDRSIHASVVKQKKAAGRKA